MAGRAPARAAFAAGAGLAAGAAALLCWRPARRLCIARGSV